MEGRAKNALPSQSDSASSCLLRRQAREDAVPGMPPVAVQAPGADAPPPVAGVPVDEHDVELVVPAFDVEEVGVAIRKEVPLLSVRLAADQVLEDCAELGGFEDVVLRKAIPDRRVVGRLGERIGLEDDPLGEARLALHG